ncbi:hypothetical protein Bpfe_000981, partial [Biomphalaria pfeifferi]
MTFRAARIRNPRTQNVKSWKMAIGHRNRKPQSSYQKSDKRLGQRADLGFSFREFVILCQFVCGKVYILDFIFFFGSNIQVYSLSIISLLFPWFLFSSA